MIDHDLSSGPITLYISEISPGDPPSTTVTAGSLYPGGRLTLVSGMPEMLGSDFTSSTVFYAPFVGDTVPVFDGTTWVSAPFTSGPLDVVGASISCGSLWAANTRHDIFAYIDGGSVKLGSKPWGGDAISARGLVRRNGLWVNADVVTLATSASLTASIPQHRATWLGSINIGSVAGALKATFTIGQARRCDVWNAYNQREILLGAAQPPINNVVVSWKPDSQYPTFKPFNNDLNNHGVYFTGLPQNIDINWHQRGFVDTTNYAIGGMFWVICKDAITNPKGMWAGYNSDVRNTALGVTATAVFVDKGSIGSHLAIMGTAKANATGCTLWGIEQTPPYEEYTQTMWIRYQG